MIDADDEIDGLQDALESKCVELLATQQPTAVDLRAVLCAVHIAAELERMGDYAEGIAKICIRIGDQPLVKPLIDIPRMADLGFEDAGRQLAGVHRPGGVAGPQSLRR